MYKILVADDEEKIRALIRKYAEFEGHTVTEASNGMEAVRLCAENDFDIIVMDVMMPELDGFSASREIRKHSDTPILMLSARGEEYDRISGFEFGADDYVVKPFSPKELMLRIDAIMKRAGARKNEEAPKKDIFRYDGLVIDFTARTVTVDGVRAELSPKEYDLLFYMCRNHQDRFPEIHCLAYRFKSCRAGICLASCHLPEKDRIIQLIERQGIIYSLYRMNFTTS